jgi:hypothetical protein
MATTNKQTAAAKKKIEEKVYIEPKRLSKMGEWLRKNPDGIGKILDMRAVMR